MYQEKVIQVSDRFCSLRIGDGSYKLRGVMSGFFCLSRVLLVLLDLLALVETPDLL